MTQHATERKVELKEPLPEALWLRRGAAPLAERAREAQRRDAGGDAPELRAAPRVAVDGLAHPLEARARRHELEHDGGAGDGGGCVATAARITIGRE